MKTIRLPFTIVIVGGGCLLLGLVIGYVVASPDAANEQVGRDGASSGNTGGLELSSAQSGNGKPASVSSFLEESMTPYTGGRIEPGEQLDRLLRGALRISDQADRGVRLRDLARAIRASDLPAAVAFAKRLSWNEQWQLLHALGNRWAEEDAPGAAAFAVKEGSFRGWNGLLYGVVVKWAATDRQAAMTWIGTQPTALRRQILQGVVEAVARQDPEAAFEMVQTQPKTEDSDWLQGQIFERWSQSDPAAAAKAAVSMKEGSTRQRALASVATGWAAQDPQAAIQWCETFEDNGTRNRLLQNVGEYWAANEPRKAMEWGLKLEEPGLRESVLRSAISQIASTDLEAAKRELNALPRGQLRDNLIGSAASTAINTDPKGAIALLDLLPEGNQRNTLVGYLTQQFAATDVESAAEFFEKLNLSQQAANIDGITARMAITNPVFAREWAEKISDPQLRSKAFRSIAGMMAQGDPREAVAWYLEKQPGQDITWIVQGWANSAPSDVLAWAKDLPDGEAKRSAQVCVLQRIAGTDLARAREVFAKDLSPDAKVMAAGFLAQEWAGRDLNAARGWAESLPTGSARESAMASIAGIWATQDPAGAVRWMERFSPGDERDRVVSQFATIVIQQDPAAAMAWASSIAEPELRHSQVEQLALQWMQSDSAAAQNWIRTTDQLTPNSRRRLLEQRDSPSWRYYGGY